MGIHFPWSRKPTIEPDASDELPWIKYQDHVSNCTDCGAPIYEEKERREHLRGIEFRMFIPHRIIRTCKCYAHYLANNALEKLTEN